MDGYTNFVYWFQSCIKEAKDCQKSGNPIKFYINIPDNYKLFTVFDQWFKKVSKIPFKPKLEIMPWSSHDQNGDTTYNSCKIKSNVYNSPRIYANYKPIMIRCRYMTNNLDLTDKNVNISHEDMSRIKNQNPYHFYTTEIVMIKGYICRWDGQMYRLVTHQ